MNFITAFATLCVIVLKLQTANSSNNKQLITKELSSWQKILQTLNDTKSKNLNHGEFPKVVSTKESTDKETTIINTDAKVIFCRLCNKTKATNYHQHKTFEMRDNLYLNNVYKDGTELQVHPLVTLTIIHSKNIKNIINRIKLKRKQVALNQHINKHNKKVFLFPIDRVVKDEKSSVNNSTIAKILKPTKRPLKSISRMSSKEFQHFNAFITPMYPLNSLTRIFKVVSNTIGNTGRMTMNDSKIINANYVSTTESPNPNFVKSRLSKTVVAAIVSGIIAFVGFTGAAIFSCSKYNCLRNEERISLIS